MTPIHSSLAYRTSSEPETKILKRLAEEFRPHVWLNIHSGMEAMLAPWDHVAEVGGARASRALQTVFWVGVPRC